MYGLGTLINVVAIIIGGLIGMLFVKRISESFQTTLRRSTGVCVLFVGIAGALEGMLKIDSDGSVVSGGSLLIILCVTLGTVIGELINIEGGFEKFGAWLKRKTGSDGDNNFINGFLHLVQKARLHLFAVTFPCLVRKRFPFLAKTEILEHFYDSDGFFGSIQNAEIADSVAVNNGEMPEIP